MDDLVNTISTPGIGFVVSTGTTCGRISFCSIALFAYSVELPKNHLTTSVRILVALQSNWTYPGQTVAPSKLRSDVNEKPPKEAIIMDNEGC